MNECEVDIDHTENDRQSWLGYLLCEYSKIIMMTCAINSDDDYDIKGSADSDSDDLSRLTILPTTICSPPDQNWFVNNVRRSAHVSHQPTRCELIPLNYRRPMLLFEHSELISYVIHGRFTRSYNVDPIRIRLHTHFAHCLKTKINKCICREKHWLWEFSGNNHKFVRDDGLANYYSRVLHPDVW